MAKRSGSTGSGTGRRATGPRAKKTGRSAPSGTAQRSARTEPAPTAPARTSTKLPSKRTRKSEKTTPKESLRTSGSRKAQVAGTKGGTDIATIAARDASAARLLSTMQQVKKAVLDEPDRSRSSKKGARLVTLSCKVHPLASAALDEISAATGISRSELLIEAVNLLLRVHQRFPIA